MPTATNVKEIFDSMCTRFRPEKAGSDSATFQFDLSGADGGKYWTHIVNQECSAGEGVPPSEPDITVVSGAEDFIKLINGELNAMTAFMQGKFKVQGNMSVALKMLSWFDMS